MISEYRIDDELYDMTREHFSEDELLDLTLAIAVINGWNRLAISFRSVPGSYQRKQADWPAQSYFRQEPTLLHSR